MSSAGEIMTIGSSMRAIEPRGVIVSDGSIPFPFGHPDYYSIMQPNGTLLLNLGNAEYSEFKTNIDRNFTINLWNAKAGSRYKLFITRNTPSTITISFYGDTQTRLIEGKPDGQTLSVIDVEVVLLGNILVNKIIDNIYDNRVSETLTWSSKKIAEELAAINLLIQNQGSTINNVTNESKATMFASPAFTGVPNAPTAASATSTTQLATTAFVMGQISISPGANLAASAAVGVGTTFARADHVHAIPHDLIAKNQINVSLLPDYQTGNMTYQSGIVGYYQAYKINTTVTIQWVQSINVILNIITGFGLIAGMRPNTTQVLNLIGPNSSIVATVNTTGSVSLSDNSLNPGSLNYITFETT